MYKRNPSLPREKVEVGVPPPLYIVLVVGLWQMCVSAFSYPFRCGCVLICQVCRSRSAVPGSLSEEIAPYVAMYLVHPCI